MSSTSVKVLILEDIESDARFMVAEVRAAGFQPHWRLAKTEDEFIAALDPLPDIVLADYTLPQYDAIRAVHLLRERKLDIPVIIVSGTIGEEAATRCLREGATDYILKDRLKRLGHAVARALEEKRLRAQQQQAESVLRESAAAARRILDTANDPYVAMDADGRTADWNTQAEKVFGWTRAEVMGRSMAEVLIPARHRESHERGRRHFLATGEGPILNQRLELEALHRDGREIPVELIVWPIQTGAEYSFSAFLRDIRDRRKSEETLRERARSAALIADVALALTTSGTLGGVLQACSESMVRNLDAAFARIWTLSADQNVLELQASGGMYAHLDGPHRRVPVGKFKIGLIAQERQPHLTNDVLTDPRVSDPEWAKREGMVAFAGYPLLVDDRLVGVMAMFARRPLSPTTFDAMAAVANQIALGIERKHTEDMLRESHQNLQSLIQASPLATIALDARGHVLLWNQAAEFIFGWSAEEVVGRLFPIVPAEEEEEFRAMMKKELRGEVRSAVELRRQRKDGARVEVSLWTAPLRDAQGQITGTIKLLADVGERKKLEDQFRQSQKMEAVGRLAGGVAHDFNNMLTIMLGYSEILEGRVTDDPEDSELIREISRAARPR